ncbi:M1 family metallopeptidase [Dyadobacter tibetensis]|uniref:M1 family metallopeptidase n=1 Tax=Dyadobacter tibetensis TaxID=1211851 RepID=UPI0004710F47|nr:M1 family metallopeptidase [Dyadobacter tibetensis]
MTLNIFKFDNRLALFFNFIWLAVAPLMGSASAIPDSTFRKVAGMVSPAGPYRPERPMPHQLIYTRLDLQLDWQRQRVPGSAVLAFRPHFYPQNILELDAKGFDIKSVVLLEDRSNLGDLSKKELDKRKTKKLSYQYDNRKLTIQLGASYTRKDTLAIRIDYVAKPNELSRDQPGDHPTDKGLYFINADGMDEGKPRQVWTQGETEANSCWFPTIDAPNQKFTHDILLTVEDNFKTLSNGLLIHSEQEKEGMRTDHWRQSIPHAPYLAMIAVGDFAVAKDYMPNGMELSYYVEPKYADDAHAIFGRTPAMIAFFSNIFGVAFPWEKYAQIAVRDFVAGAMENTTATVHEESVQNDTRSLVDGNSDAVIAHELAHHWFGDYVTAEEWGQLPLNEAFANYAEYLWAEYKDGLDEADWVNLQETKQYLAESETKKVPLIRYFYKNNDDMFDSHSYAKGGRILHMLRRQVGDDAFFASLRDYLKNNALGKAEIAQLRISFEKITGQDLNWFFDQWFFRPGHPILDIKQEYSLADKQLKLTIQQQQDTLASTVYRLPVPVDIWVGGKKTRHQIVIDQAKQTFTFPATEKPNLVLFDPESSLLASIEHGKDRQEMKFQYNNAERFLPKYLAIAQLEGQLADSTVRNVLIKAMNDPFWKIRQMAIANFAEYAGENFAAIEKTIQMRAREDAHPQVRAEAIITLATYGDNNSDKIFKEALADTSYQVVSIALDKYLLNRPDDAEQIALQFESSPNDAVVTSVGNYYAGQAQPERYEWFLEKMKRMKPTEKYNFLQVFGKYLIKSKADVQRRSIPVLESLARNNPAYFVRFGAYQALGLLTDISGVTALRKDIRAKETEPKLKEMYDQFSSF